MTDIDDIVRLVRFPGWQNTKAGEREVQKTLRKVIYVKYQVKDQDLFDKAFGYTWTVSTHTHHHQPHYPH